jgi:hypothetical protein
MERTLLIAEPQKTLETLVTPSHTGDKTIVNSIVHDSKDYIDPLFQEVRKFFTEEKYSLPGHDPADYTELFFKEYGITDVLTHCFEVLYENKYKADDKAAEICYADTFLMMLVDQTGNSVFFQKYNNHMIVMREVRKIRKPFSQTTGGEFEAIAYEKCLGPDCKPYLRIEAAPVRFVDQDNIHLARSKTVQYMKDMVKYHDIETKSQLDEEKQPFQDYVIVDSIDSNRFRIGVDHHDYSFLFNYSCLPSTSFAGFNGLHAEVKTEVMEMQRAKQIKDDVAEKLLNFISINQSYLEAAVNSRFLG